MEIVSPPQELTLDRPRQTRDVYYLTVPDTVVEIRDLRDNPTLTYTVSIPELGYSRSSIHSLGRTGGGRVAISLDRDTIDAATLDKASYRATVELVVRGTDTTRTVYTDSTTVAVIG